MGAYWGDSIIILAQYTDIHYLNARISLIQEKFLKIKHNLT